MSARKKYTVSTRRDAFSGVTTVDIDEVFDREPTRAELLSRSSLGANRLYTLLRIIYLLAWPIYILVNGSDGSYPFFLSLYFRGGAAALAAVALLLVALFVKKVGTAMKFACWALAAAAFYVAFRMCSLIGQGDAHSLKGVCILSLETYIPALALSLVLGLCTRRELNIRGKTARTELMFKLVEMDLDLSALCLNRNLLFYATQAYDYDGLWALLLPIPLFLVTLIPRAICFFPYRKLAKDNYYIAF